MKLLVTLLSALAICSTAMAGFVPNLQCASKSVQISINLSKCETAGRDKAPTCLVQVQVNRVVNPQVNKIMVLKTQLPQTTSESLMLVTPDSGRDVVVFKGMKNGATNNFVGNVHVELGATVVKEEAMVCKDFSKPSARPGHL